MEKIRLVIGLVILVSYLAVVPTCFGIMGTELVKGNREKSFAEKYMWGNIILWTLFQIICVPLDLVNASFNTLVLIYGVIIVGMLAVIFVRKFQVIRRSLLELKVNITLFDVVIIAIILLQVFTYIFGVTYNGADDTTYISASQYAVQKNHFIQGDWKLLLTSWNYYIAFLGKITGIHVAAIAHTILPVWLVPMAYMVYTLLGRKLFQNNQKKTALFVFLMSVLITFGGYSWYVLTLRLAICVWHGKAVMASIMLPFLFYYLICTSHYGKKQVFGLALIVIATISMSLMGVGLSILMILASIIIRLNVEKIKKKIPLVIMILCIAMIAVFYGMKLSLLDAFKPENISALFPKSVDMMLQAYNTYWNNSKIQYVYYFLLIYIIFRRKKDEEHLFLKKYIICLYVFIFNPIVYYISYGLLQSANVYVRVYYILFVEIFIAYALTAILEDLKAKWKQYVVGLAAIIAIVCCGEPYWKLGQYSWYNNIYKIPSQTVELGDAIGQYTDEDTWLVADMTTYLYMQQYSAQYRIGYIYQGESLDDILGYMKNNMLEYLVWNKDENDLIKLEDMGAVIVAETNTYNVYKVNLELIPE